MSGVIGQLGRYKILRRIAVGGMGEIFLGAREGPLGVGAPVAIKLLRPELALDQQFVKMLADEAHVCRYLNHQNIVSVFDFAEHSGSYFLAMEYVHGMSLRELMDLLAKSGQRLELTMAYFIISELLKALKYAHSRKNHAGEPLGIVHRDVTPQNLLLSVQGEVKLTDFGLARAKGRQQNTDVGVLKGKFGYLAPEAVRYEPVDARADVFCAGVVLYEMVAGQHPAAGCSLLEGVERFEHNRVLPPSTHNPQIPQALDAVIMRALASRPEERWGTAAALGAAIQELALASAGARKAFRESAGLLAALVTESAPRLEDSSPPSSGEFDEVEDTAIPETLQQVGPLATDVCDTVQSSETLRSVRRPDAAGAEATDEGVETDRQNDLADATIAVACSQPDEPVTEFEAADAPAPDSGADPTVAGDLGMILAEAEPDTYASDAVPLRAAPRPRSGDGPTVGLDALRAQTRPTPPCDPTVGLRTAAWQAGGVAPEALDWDDEAAGRRVVSTRNAPGNALPPAAARFDASKDGPPMPPRRASTGAHRVPSWGIWVVLCSFLFGVGLVLRTDLFSAHIAVRTEPPGAQVFFDGVLQDVRTPAQLTVQPLIGHTLEFRLPGYPSKVLEAPVRLGLREKLEMTVVLERPSRAVDISPVAGRVFVNEVFVGEGPRVELPRLEASEAIRLRVEARGFRAWQHTFETAALMPKQLDVPLERR